MAGQVGRKGGATGDSLLPKTYEEFGTKQYWEDFFKQREEKAFEWYGSYKDLSEYVTPLVGREDRVLVIGCGNSDFSSDLYLRGGHRHITNVDFSESVIEEMRAKTAKACPAMNWQVMDVTCMSFTDGAWDVVVDKGTLDAIYNTQENEAQADEMLDEVERVLSSTGRYLIVTLGQDFILSKLLRRFAKKDRGWALELHALEARSRSFSGNSAKGPTPPSSPFLTLVAVVRRRGALGIGKGFGGGGGGGGGEEGDPLLRVSFDSTARQLPGGSFLTFGEGGHGAALSHVTAAREWHHTLHSLRHVAPGRVKGDVDIYLGPSDKGKGEGEEEKAATEVEVGPRYSLSIVDLVPATREPQPCAVFIIPQERNHEWLFATADGLRQVASGSDYERLICVRKNRGHKFASFEEVQNELGGIVKDFFPLTMDPGYRVPYLAVGQADDGSRVEVAHGELPLCGAYSVEEEEDGDGPSGALLRRLVFLRNQHVIQTEVRLIPPKKSSSGGAGGSRKKRGGGKKTSKAAKSSAGEEGEGEGLVMDYGYMCFDYHRAMLAGLWLLGPSLKTAKAQGTRLKGMVLGLGGGALPLFLSHYYPVLDVTVLELEGGLRDVANRWFGFSETEARKVVVGDGLVAVSQGAENEPGSVDVLLVDVDNKDASIGISCPGPEFLTTQFLQACRVLLKRSGLLVMNLAARSSEAQASALQTFSDAFSDGGEVLAIHPSDEDVNHVIFALNSPRASSSSGGGGLGHKAAVNLALGLEKWLQEGKGGGGQADPLELSDLLTRISALGAVQGENGQKEKKGKK